MWGVKFSTRNDHKQFFIFASIVLEDKFKSMGGIAFHSLQTLLK